MQEIKNEVPVVDFTQIQPEPIKPVIDSGLIIEAELESKTDFEKPFKYSKKEKKQMAEKTEKSPRESFLADSVR